MQNNPESGRLSPNKRFDWNRHREPLITTAGILIILAMTLAFLNRP